MAAAGLDAALLANPKTKVPAKALLTAGISASSVLKKLQEWWDKMRDSRVRAGVSESSSSAGLDRAVEVEAPVAHASVIAPLMSEKIVNVHDKDEGEGVILSFSQLADFVVKPSVSGTDIFSGTGLWVNQPSGDPKHEKYLSPMTMGGKVSQMASMYSKFRFTKLILAYVPATSTTTDQSFCIGYSRDHDISAIADFADVSQLDSTVAGPGWTPMTIDLNLETDQLFFTTMSDETAASTRLASQGVIFGKWDAATAANITTGSIFVMGELHLFGRIPDQGFTVAPRFAPFFRPMEELISLRPGHGLPFTMQQKDKWKLASYQYGRCRDTGKFEVQVILQLEDRESREEAEGLKPDVAKWAAKHDEIVPWEDSTSPSVAPPSRPGLRRGDRN